MQYLLLLICFFFCFSLSSKTISYQYDTTDFPNPERGFYWQTNPNYNEFLRARSQDKVTLFRWPIVLQQFISSSISSSFISQLDSGFAAARRAGSKIIPRFAYNYDESGIDAPLDTVLKHIDQLTPLLKRNYDVIAILEAGFIGAWGEWHTSSNNLTTLSARKAILLKLLSALPKERMVVVRTPAYKQQIFSTTQPLDSSLAFNGSDISRTGQHNDCLGASETDWGTYPSNSIEAMKNYLNLDNRYVPMEGETCNPSDYSTCTAILAELKRMRWDALNLLYHPTVISDWKTNGCFSEISKKLGYRFVLINSTFPDSLRPNSRLQAEIRITNIGFGKCYNPRGLELVLREITSKQKFVFKINKDPRRWLANDTAIIFIDTIIPSSIQDGDYALFLNLPDTISSLYSRPAYSIRLANKNVWEDSTGYNYLNHILYIRKTASVSSSPITYYAYLSTLQKSNVNIYDIRGKFICKINDLNNVNPIKLANGIYFCKRNPLEKKLIINKSINYK
jgi:hypothetical protein